MRLAPARAKGLVAAARPLLLGLLLALAISGQRTAALPILYAKRTTDCAKVPTTAADLTGRAPHRAPDLLGSAITFAVASQSGAAANVLCPGNTYAVTVSFPGSNGHYLLTSTVGTFSSRCGANATASLCPNRVCNCASDFSCQSQAPASATYGLTLPCDLGLAGTTLTLKAVWVGGNDLSKMFYSSTNSSIGQQCPPCPPPPPPVKVVLTPPKPTINAGAKARLTITVSGPPPPAAGETKVVAIKAAPSGIVTCTPANAKLNANNKATVRCTGKGAGTATVTATYAPGGAFTPGTGSATVTVRPI